MYKSAIAVFLWLLGFTSLAETVPQEGSKLNYRIIGFSFPEREQVDSYKVQIALGNYTSDKAFEEHIVVTAAARYHHIIAEVPAFGKQYTWRVTYWWSLSKWQNGVLYHFSTLMAPEVNPDSVRMRITLSSEKYKGHYVFVDCNKVLYDMDGKPVWFFPSIENKPATSLPLRDLKSTPYGTITSSVNGRVYELGYNGAVLWQGPDNNTISLDTMSPDHGYHHEFTRLANGHYMVMGFEEPYWQLPAPPDSSVYVLWASKIKREGNTYFQKTFFGTVTEYDEEGAVVWRWSGADYFKKSDLSTRMLRSKLFDINNTHANAFYFDEKTKNLYISFRDISRIIQVQYPGGELIHTYGRFYSPADGQGRRLSNGVFCGQHSPGISGDGYLYLFNNNSCHRDLPSIVMLRQPKPGKDTLEKVWEFECPMDGGEMPKGTFLYGGNVSELPDSSFFVCMGGIYGKLFIVNRDKNILWSGQPEKWDAATGQWIKDGGILSNKMKEGSYRAHIIDRSELEHLIWGEPIRK